MSDLGGNLKVSGERVLVLGNSPAIEVLRDGYPRGVVSIGVNRMRGKLKLPDIMTIMDPTVEPEWIPEVGEVRGILTLDATPEIAARPDAVELTRQECADPKRYQWPEKPGDPLIACSCTPGFAAQWAIVNGAAEVALLGVDYNQRQLADLGMPTHNYGNNPVVEPRPMPVYQIPFWVMVRREAAARGVKCLNLSPYDGAPFHVCGWPRMSWGAYLMRCETSAGKARARSGGAPSR